MDLNGKAILLTGGSAGIGKATARILVEKGAQVAITARDGDFLNKAAAEVGAYPIQADVSKPEDIKKTYDDFLAKFGKLDVLINNAGLAKGSATIDEIELEDLQYVYSVNVFGAALMAKEAAKLFKKQNHGHIVNIASTAATKGYERGTIYSSSKWALKGMTQCWQAELRKYNVRVMLVNPSYVPTSFGMPGKELRAEEDNKLTPDEIAHGIVCALEMNDRGFIPEFSVFATNPF